MPVNTIIGPPARGEKFFKSERIVQDFWDKISKGSHILISAPRRIGKTSLMYYILETPTVGYESIYVIVQSIQTSNAFFKKIFRGVFDCLNTRQKFSTKFFEMSKQITGRIKSISVDGITLDDKEINYYEELISLLKKINLEENKLVIMIDEFADTVENIRKTEGIEEAVVFLEKNRDLRLIPEISNKVQFIYASSIGLEGIVDRIDAAKAINDLYPFKITPFTNTEAKELISMLLKGANFTLDNKVIDYMLKEIDWLIPFNIQIIIDEIDKICQLEGTNIAKKEFVDLAFRNAIESKNYFETWNTRLRINFKGNSYRFVTELVNNISQNLSMHSNEIYDLAVKNHLVSKYKELVNVLVYDGYINNNDDPKIYKFNSPILRMWWNKYVAN